VAVAARVGMRIDSTAQSGHGHLVRSTVLADALAAKGADVTLLIRGAVTTSAHRVLFVPDDVAVAAEPAWVRERGPWDVIVTDLYQPTQDIVDGWRAGPWKLACIDDVSPLRFDCDLLVCPTPWFRHEVLPGMAYVHGTEAMMVRRQFRGAAPRVVRDRVERVLVCFGGSDPPDATSRTVALLPAAFPDASAFDVVVGASYPHRAALDAVPKDARVSITENAKDMAERMAAADVGILSAGTLLAEAYCAGLPAILVSLTADQGHDADDAEARGAAIHLGSEDALTRDTLARAAARILPRDTRAKMSLAGRALASADRSLEIAARILTLAAARSSDGLSR
jgi:UDP-2,4-diacetamido-2,4,6-trideoxy-beta-L-altropyranose hydrolase